jgi:hypothetical protein
MALRFNLDAKNKVLDTGFDTIWNSGILELRTGVQPAAASDAAAGTLLLTKTLPADIFGAASAGLKSKTGDWNGVSVALGKIGWFRLKMSTDPGGITQAFARLDGLVTLTGQGGELTVDNLTVGAIGQSVPITSFVVGMFG